MGYREGSVILVSNSSVLIIFTECPCVALMNLWCFLSSIEAFLIVVIDNVSNLILVDINNFTKSMFFHYIYLTLQLIALFLANKVPYLAPWQAQIANLSVSKPFYQGF